MLNVQNCLLGFLSQQVSPFTTTLLPQSFDLWFDLMIICQEFHPCNDGKYSSKHANFWENYTLFSHDWKLYFENISIVILKKQEHSDSRSNESYLRKFGVNMGKLLIKMLFGDFCIRTVLPLIIIMGSPCRLTIKED